MASDFFPPIQKCQIRKVMVEETQESVMLTSVLAP
jgi:hypothetical protein